MTMIEYLNQNSFLIAAISGAAGGIVNCILFEKGFIFPRIESFKENGGVKKKVNTGFIGNIVLGIASGIIVWGLGASSIDTQRLIAICLFSGVSGGSLITSMMQKSSLNKQLTEITSQRKELDLQLQKVTSMHGIITKIVKDSSEE